MTKFIVTVSITLFIGWMVIVITSSEEAFTLFMLSLMCAIMGMTVHDFLWNKGGE